MRDMEMVDTGACARCPKDDLGYATKELEKIKAAIIAFDILEGVGLDAINYERRYMAYGELMMQKRDLKNRIKQLKAEIKAKKKGGKK